MSWVTVTIAETRGSSPREAGAAMRVWADRQEGSIGGGTLEWQAVRLAREMLAGGRANLRRQIALGPELGQCCGGVVLLDFARDAEIKHPEQPPLWIWGAGHVGRAIAATMAPFGDRPITLIDTAANRMPTDLPDGITPLVAADMPRAVRHAPADAAHLILTYSHDIDLQLCDALLRHGFGFAGLIGSATKWARFRSRLSALGHGPAQISSITCPIGDPSLGKHPQAIALGVAAALCRRAAPAEACRDGTA